MSTDVRTFALTVCTQILHAGAPDHVDLHLHPALAAIATQVMQQGGVSLRQTWFSVCRYVARSDGL